MVVRRKSKSKLKKRVKSKKKTSRKKRVLKKKPIRKKQPKKTKKKKSIKKKTAKEKKPTRKSKKKKVQKRTKRKTKRKSVKIKDNKRSINKKSLNKKKIKSKKNKPKKKKVFFKVSKNKKHKTKKIIKNKKNKSKKIKKQKSKKNANIKKDSNPKKTTPVLLMILDGFGIRSTKKCNAVKLAKMPYYHSLIRNYPDSKLIASGTAVGLPNGQIGNSEVGHMTIGSGRVIDTDLVHINKEIRSGKFFKNSVLNRAMRKTKSNNKTLHFMGLLSDGGVHSHIKHLFALLKLAKKHKIKNVYIHCFLDGRDTHPKAGINYLKQLINFCKKNKIGSIASIIGRFYGMDRDNRWKRENKAYSLIVDGKGRKFIDHPLEAIRYAYTNHETDEFVKPTLIDDEGLIKNNDTIIFFNFRSDRAREITKAFTIKSFHSFRRKFVKTNFVCLTMYDRHFKLPVAFPPRNPKNTLGEIIAKNRIKQLRVAETEKYPHVTFFFNGGIETPNKYEDRILIHSPKVLTYDLKPEMSAPQITKKLLVALKKKKYKFIVLNFANPDMVGHTGSLKAAEHALEDLDPLIKKVTEKVLSQEGTILMIADHGNCETMCLNNRPHTAHTTNLVPCILINNNIKNKRVKLRNGSLKDVAPTILKLLQVTKPDEMTGRPLINNKLQKRL